MKRRTERRRYPLNFKQDALRLSDKLGVAEASDKLDIPLSTLQRWRCKKHKLPERIKSRLQKLTSWINPALSIPNLQWNRIFKDRSLGPGIFSKLVTHYRIYQRRPSKIRISTIRLGKIRTIQKRPSKIRLFTIRPFKVRLSTIRPFKVSLLNMRPLKIRFGTIRPRKICSNTKILISKIPPFQMAIMNPLSKNKIHIITFVTMDACRKREGRNSPFCRGIVFCSCRLAFMDQMTAEKGQKKARHNSKP